MAAHRWSVLFGLFSVASSFVPACNERSRVSGNTGLRSRPTIARWSATKESDSDTATSDRPHDCETTTQLGNLRVPLVGTGTLSWSSQRLERLENPALQSLMNVALESNTAFFDTAERYGSNWKTALGLGWGETESLIRHLVENSATRTNHPSDDSSPTCTTSSDTSNHRPTCMVATKFTPSPWRTTVQSVVDACNESRQRLGVNQIDLYQLNMPDIVQPFNKIRPGTTVSKDTVYWRGLAECHRRGLVKNVGVCNYGPTLLAQCRDALDQHGGVPLASNQIAYSLMGRHNGAQETVRYCHEAGIQVLAAYPLAMGLLTGKYAPTNASTGRSTPSSLRTSTKSVLETRDLQGYVDRLPPLLVVLDDIATSRHTTLAQVALNYIVCQGIIPIPGARTVEQFHDNMGSMTWRLSDTEQKRLDDAADQLGFGFDGAGFKRVGEKFVGYGMEQWNLD